MMPMRLEFQEHGVFNELDQLIQATKRFIEEENILESKEEAKKRLEYYEMAMWVFKRLDDYKKGKINA